MNEPLSPQEQTTHRINEIYSVYQTFFCSGIHTVLWHILFSKSMKGKTVTFYPHLDNYGIALVLACNTGGYTQTAARFVKSISFESALNICMLLSHDVFKQLPAEHNKIVDLSFCRSPKGPFNGFEIN